MKDKAVPAGLVPLVPSGSRNGLFRVVKNATGKTLFLLSFLSNFIVHVILFCPNLNFIYYILYIFTRVYCT